LNGAKSVLETAAGAGVDLCLANPGTTEVALVAALDEVPEIRTVLGLVEGVCAGAADGYARMTGRPALTLLHLGPGLANALANLHNARRARSPVVNIVGEHHSHHRGSDPLLNSDIEGLAGPMSAWVRTVDDSHCAGRDTAEAIAAAQRGAVSTLIVPADYLTGTGTRVEPLPVPRRRIVDDPPIGAAGRRLQESTSTALLLGGPALSERALQAAARVVDATGAQLFCETFPARLERGGALPTVERFPYLPEDALAALAEKEVLVLAGAVPPVAFFAYPGLPSVLIPEGVESISIAEPDDDAADALERLAELVGDRSSSSPAPTQALPELPNGGALTARSACEVLAALQPENAIVVDEGITSGLAYFPVAAAARRHTYLGLTGGALGQGLPAAAGAALACPDRQVIAFQADGSAMYTSQALWTIARERLNVVVLICANQKYRIVQQELARSGVEHLGAASKAVTELQDPAIDWLALSRGMGVQATRASTTQELVDQFSRALRQGGPYLIEMVLRSD
jgi:acetolactate synthase-1/2/3 large subunit